MPHALAGALAGKLPCFALEWQQSLDQGLVGLRLRGSEPEFVSNAAHVCSGLDANVLLAVPNILWEHKYLG